MKVFVVSDTHGHIENFLIGIMDMEKPDLIVHLGDYVEDGIRIEKETGVETIIVRGNGDYRREEFKDDRIFDLKDKKLFITHGHRYGVGYGIDTLFYRGMEKGADIVLFGHTHVALLVEEEGIMVMNPGSPYQPRGLNRKKTFGIIEIARKISGRIVDID